MKKIQNCCAYFEHAFIINNSFTLLLNEFRLGFPVYSIFFQIHPAGIFIFPCLKISINIKL